MKKLLITILCFFMILSGCTANKEDNSVSYSDENIEEQFNDLSDKELQTYIDNAIYSELVDTLDEDEFYVEEVNTSYVSKEYLEEVEYNSKSNIFFGYSLKDLENEFIDTKYVFSLSEKGETTVEELEVIDNNVSNTILKNIAIGSGVILISVTVAVVTKNPALSVNAGKSVKIIFTASSMGAKAGAMMASQSSAIGGTVAFIAEALRTNDLSKATQQGLLAASEGFKFGAIFGTVKGIADGIKVVGNTKYFAEGTIQAQKYPEGVEFTDGPEGLKYPRFESYAKATAKFDLPTVKDATNHTGLSGNYYWDSKLANLQCGFNETPEGYVWHHVEDMQTMILIPKDLHNVALGGMSHKGGASLITEFLGI